MFSTKFVVVVVATLQNAMFSAYLLLLWQPCRKQCSVQICCCCGDPAESNVQCKYVVVVATLLNAVSSTPKFVVYQWLWQRWNGNVVLFYRLSLILISAMTPTGLPEKNYRGLPQHLQISSSYIVSGHNRFLPYPLEFSRNLILWKISTKPRHWTRSWASCIHLPPPLQISLRYIGRFNVTYKRVSFLHVTKFLNVSLLRFWHTCYFPPTLQQTHKEFSTFWVIFYGTKINP